MSGTDDRPRPAVRTDHVLRAEAPHVLGALVRRFGRFELAEDATQEALVAATQSWGDDIPREPRSWLIRVGYRKMIDLLRSEEAARRREERIAYADPVLADPVQPSPAVSDRDDSLDLLLLCCHPALSEASQIALTLRAVGGLTTAEIAHAYGTTEATMAVRISRAKQTLKNAGARLQIRDLADASERARTAMRILYLVFNEGYTATAGDALTRVDLTDEAIRLTRMLHRLLPKDPEAAGLLALMLLTDARRATRIGADDELVLLTAQERDRWDRQLITEGQALIEDAWQRDQVGPYQLQAAVAAVHAQAPTGAETDWPQIAALYLWLERINPTNPIRLSRVVAVGHAFGSQRGLALLDELDRDGRLTDDPLVSQRTHAVRAHLLHDLGDHEAARKHFSAAAELTSNQVERQYLLARADESR